MGDAMTPPTTTRRTMALELEPGAAEVRAADAAIPIAISSDYPVMRTDGFGGPPYEEVLEHTAAAVDLSRAERGLPLLLDHDPREQIGRVFKLRAEGGKLRGEIRFSSSQRAQEIRKDIQDGLRVDVSVGYQIVQSRMERPKDTGKLARQVVTRWTPHEVSSVAVPADPTVGVGRSASFTAPAPTQETRGMSTQATPQQDERVTDILALARQYDQPMERAEAWIRGGATVERVKNEILASYGDRARPMTPPGPEEWADQTRRLGEYSFTRAIINAGDGAPGPERERTEDLARKFKRSINKHTILLPVGEIGTRVQTTTGVGTGKELVLQEHVGHIDPLRNAMRVAQLGATVLPGLTGNADFTKQTSDVTLSWMGENPGVDVVASDIGTGLVSLRPKTAMASHDYTRQQLTMGTPEAEQFARQSFIASHALGLDRAAVQGSGASNEPTGILNTAGIGSVAGGTNGLAPSYDHMVDLITTVKTANGVVGPMGFLSTPGIEGKLRKTQEFASSNGVPVWRGGEEGEVAGYRAFSSNQVPSNLVKGTSTDCHAIIFGSWQDLVIGLWGILEIVVDPYTLAKKGRIILTSFQMVDVAVKHAQSFAAMKDARTV